MKYQSLPIIASCLSVLTWIVVAAGVISSILLGIRAATLLASITFLLGGFLFTAIFVLILLATSKFIYLFLDMQECLSKMAGKEEPRH